MKIGVLGAGVMGGGIAQVCASHGYEVVCHDISADALAKGRDVAISGRYGIERGVERAKLTREQADAAIARMTFSAEFDDLASAELVIEAVPERLDVKIRVFRDLDRACPPSTILASNTSGLPIAALAAATDRPDRVIGWHWASPAPVMRMAEIITTVETSDATTEAVCEIASACGKNPVVVRDQPMAWGFVANRVYFAMVAEARRVVDEGVATHEQVDQLMMDCFNWPAGPFGMVRGAGSGWS